MNRKAPDDGGDDRHGEIAYRCVFTGFMTVFICGAGIQIAAFWLQVHGVNYRDWLQIALILARRTTTPFLYLSCLVCVPLFVAYDDGMRRWIALVMGLVAVLLIPTSFELARE